MTAIPVIVGPTAGGKSAVAVELALLLGERGRRAEVVTADAFQVYVGLDIGTAKPTRDEMRGVTHHLVDIVDPTERFTAGDWLTNATRAIEDCRARGVTPIVVGGTHLYVKLLIDGMFEGPGADEGLRVQLRAMEPAARRAELERVDPVSAARLHPNDDRRTIRALEVFRLTGRPISEHQRQWDAKDAELEGGPFRLVGLVWPTESVNARINARAKSMLERGLVEEVRGLWQRRALGPQAKEALGYKQIIEHLEGGCTLDEAVETIKIETRRFAKNQRTWLRRLQATPGSVWIAAADRAPRELAQEASTAIDPSP